MITDEEIAQLPENSQLAFVEFEKILRDRLHKEEDAVAGEQYGDATSYRLEYINKVVAAALYYDIEDIKNCTVPRSNENVAEACRDFQTEVDHFTIQVRLSVGPRTRRESVGLDEDTKAEIHDHITKIRLVIDHASLSVEK